MPKPRPSVTKRQRENARREKQQMKAEKRAARKAGETTPDQLETEESPSAEVP